MSRYFQAKDKDGFLRLHGSTFKEVVPNALRSAMAEAGVNARKAPGSAATSTQRTTAGPPGGKPQPAAGFLPVGKKPDMMEVNRNATTPEMWQKHQAVLKNGKRVQWS